MPFLRPMPWPVLRETTAFQNRWVQVRLQTVQLPDGRSYDYSIVDRPAQGVGIVLLDGAGRLLLEREYRHGIGEVVWQLPGGLIDEGEGALLSAQRELREETGYEAALWEPLDCFYDNPALGNAASHLFLARQPRHVGSPRWDEAESLTLHWQEMAWLREAIPNGQIVDRVVLAAVAMLWARHLV